MHRMRYLREILVRRLSRSIAVKDSLKHYLILSCHARLRRERVRELTISPRGDSTKETQLFRCKPLMRLFLFFGPGSGAAV